MTIGENIRQARKQAGLTQRALSELTGIAEPTIRKYEANKLNPKIETITKIARAMGLYVDELRADDGLHESVRLKQCKELFLQLPPHMQEWVYHFMVGLLKTIDKRREMKNGTDA